MSREKVQKQQTIYSEGAVGKRQVGAENLNAGASGFGPGAGGGKNYTHDTSAETLLPSFEQQSTTFLPGRITKVSVALAVDTSIAATMSLKQLQESVAAIVGPTTLAEHVKLTVIDLGKQKETLPLVQQTKQANVFLNFFQGNGFFGTAMKIFAFIGTLLGILLIGIVGLNFLNIASKQGTEKIVEQGLGDEFDDVMNSTEDSDEIEDYGEQRALEQQEALLREMMNPSAEPVAAAKAGTAHSYSAGGASNAEFESLLNNFQSVANSKPDLLARKIQVWLEQDAN